MKKIFIAIYIVLLTSFFSKAQIYTPFPSNTAIWTTTHCQYFLGYMNTAKIGMFGDTVINSKTYKKLYQSLDSIFDINNSTYQAALREENKKIFYILNTSSDELLLYDFTKGIGDTVKIQLVPYLPDSVGMVIANIDSIFIDGAYRKRYYFPTTSSYHQEEYWIEGVGSTFGLFSPFFSISDNGFDLRCMAADNKVIYTSNTPSFLCAGNPPVVNCNDSLLFTGFDKSPANRHCLIYPNPATTILTIMNFNKTEGIENVSVLNWLGQTVLQSNKGEKNKIELNIENFPRGIYFIRIGFSDKNFMMEKVWIE